MTHYTMALLSVIETSNHYWAISLAALPHLTLWHLIEHPTVWEVIQDMPLSLYGEDERSRGEEERSENIVSMRLQFIVFFLHSYVSKCACMYSIYSDVCECVCVYVCVPLNILSRHPGRVGQPHWLVLIPSGQRAATDSGSKLLRKATINLGPV